MLPGDGRVAWVDRGELAEASARIIATPSSEYADKTIFLTKASAVSLLDVAKTIDEVMRKIYQFEGGL